MEHRALRVGRHGLGQCGFLFVDLSFASDLCSMQEIRPGRLHHHHDDATDVVHGALFSGVWTRAALSCVLGLGYRVRHCVLQGDAQREEEGAREGRARKDSTR